MNYSALIIYQGAVTTVIEKGREFTQLLWKVERVGISRVLTPKTAEKHELLLMSLWDYYHFHWTCVFTARLLQNLLGDFKIPADIS